MFLFTVFYLLDYITKSITVDGEEIRLIMTDEDIPMEQEFNTEGWPRIRADVRWSFKFYMYSKDIQRT